MAPSRDKLRSRLRGRTSLTESAIEVGGRIFRVTHPASADALFDEEEFEKDESIPYWADLWPSAIALSRHVSTLDFSGERAIEIGCGIGLPSIAVSESGAKVVATDHYESALDFAAYNAKENLGKEIETATLDWRNPLPDGLGTFDVALAADVLYERVNARYLAKLVPELLSPEGKIILADPRRPGAALFVEEMEERGFRASKKSVIVEQSGREVVVNIHHLGR